MTDDLAAWVRLLDHFEKALDAADEHTAPHVVALPTGPPPEEVRARAEAILARQQLMLSGVIASRAKVARQLIALRKVPTSTPDAPAYLDIEG